MQLREQTNNQEWRVGDPNNFELWKSERVLTYLRVPQESDLATQSLWIRVRPVVPPVRVSHCRFPVAAVPSLSPLHSNWRIVQTLLRLFLHRNGRSTVEQTHIWARWGQERLSRQDSSICKRVSLSGIYCKMNALGNYCPIWGKRGVGWSEMEKND